MNKTMMRAAVAAFALCFGVLTANPAMAVRHSTVTFSANASLTQLAVLKNCNANEIKGMIQIGGSTFGGGTLSLFLSLDGGTTKNTLDDLSGIPYSTAQNKTINISLPVFDTAAGDQIILYGTLAGATSPDVTVKIIDQCRAG